ncbi:MAG TPA: hypothetical protein VMW40_04870 [Candidatus Bathyarchaeia archaeon]|nr:hypothetical protein [Candidatus Bathyarchaeia archaeon]
MSEKDTREGIFFGRRKIESGTDSYKVVIPKTLGDVVGLKQGAKIGFVLDDEGKIVLQVEERSEEEDRK